MKAFAVTEPLKIKGVLVPIAEYKQLERELDALKSPKGSIYAGAATIGHIAIGFEAGPCRIVTIDEARNIADVIEQAIVDAATAKGAQS